MSRDDLNHIIENAVLAGKGIGKQAFKRSEQLENEFNYFMKKFHIVSPTGKKIIRVDRQGDGRFGAPRGHRIHTGIDWECDVGQDTYAMIQGRVVRNTVVYEGENWQGIELRNDLFICRMSYLVPDLTLIGTHVMAGHRVGTAQDISKKFGGGMKPHIHATIFFNYEGFLR